MQNEALSKLEKTCPQKKIGRYANGDVNADTKCKYISRYAHIFICFTDTSSSLHIKIIQRDAKIFKF